MICYHIFAILCYHMNFFCIWLPGSHIFLMLGVARESQVAKMPCGSSGGNCGDGAPGRMVRLAPLGAAEDAALCGSEARFLFGYEKPDRSRWLVELDGNCHLVVKMEGGEDDTFDTNMM